MELSENVVYETAMVRVRFPAIICPEICASIFTGMVTFLRRT